MDTANKNSCIALIGGGYTEEAEISRQSCHHIQSLLPELPLIIVDIESPSAWWAKDEKDVYPINKHNFSYTNKRGELQRFSTTLILIHGTPGEDGKLQGYFELIQQPYMGCSSFLSALTFNKQYTKLVASSLGISTPQSTTITSKENVELKQLPSLPCFVKPNAGGSSLAISLVQQKAELENAIKLAQEEDSDTTALIEELIRGREFSVGIYKQEDGRLVILPITEIVSHNAFFDFKAKYENQSDEITPAKINNPKIEEQLHHYTTTMYEHLGLILPARADFIWSEEQQQVYFIEINTIPGMTEKSILPQQLHVAGVDIGALFTNLINISLA